eukprot:jgi/Tetstr1/446328/TSEL_033871.t1
MARAGVRAWAEHEADPDADDAVIRPPTRTLLALMEVHEVWKARQSADWRQEGGGPYEGNAGRQFGEMPAEPTETTRDTTTLALLQALALKVDALSTRLDEQDNNKHKEQRDIPSDDDEVGEGGKAPEHDAQTAAATGGARGAPAVFIDPRDWEDLLPRALWRPRKDEADRYLTEANKTTSRDEYRHMLCYVGDADEARLTYLRRFKAKKALTPEEQVAERIIYSRVFDTAEHERSANVVDGLLTTLADKRLDVGLAAAAKVPASATFTRQAMERDTDRDKARKEKHKAARERREQQRREADAKNRDKNGGRTGDKTRD